MKALTLLPAYFFLWGLIFFSPRLLTQPPTVLPPGRLVLLLHETGTAGNESLHKKDIGAVTMRAAIALTQTAGILIISPTIWANLVSRVSSFWDQLQQPGSLPYLFEKAWTTNSRAPSAETQSQINAMLRTDPTLLHQLYIAQQWPTPDSWRAYLHPQASLIILLPDAYLEQRLGTLPRSLPTTYTPIDYASGLLLSSCKPLLFPTQSMKKEEHQRLITHAHHLIKRSTFSIAALSDCFIAQNSIHPLLTTTWNIYMVGHGTYHTLNSPWHHLEQAASNQATSNKNNMCGISSEQFTQFLTMCNTTLSTNCLYYQSCYGANHQLLTTTTRATTRAEKPSFTFHLIAGAIGEAPVHVLMPRSHNGAITADTNIALFFDYLEQAQLSWPQILSTVTPVVSVENDIHAISATPLLLEAGQTEAVPVDINSMHSSSTSVSKDRIKAGVSIFSHHHEATHKHHKKPFIVRGQRALLIIPTAISTPLAIHPYQHINYHSPHPTSHFMCPAILSLHPGNALHHCASLTAHAINFKTLLTQGFLPFTKQKSSKVYIFDSLTVTNDLATNFTSSAGSLWTQVATTVHNWLYGRPSPLITPRITLKKAVIMLNAQRLTCVFLEPQNADEYQAHKIVCYRPEHTHTTTPQTLTKERLSLSKHGAIYKKYTQLCKKQAQ